MSLYVILTIPYSRKIKDVFDERRRITRPWTGKRHPELVSGSVRGEGKEKARSEMLKFAVKREQSQACLNFAEREQIEQC